MTNRRSYRGGPVSNREAEGKKLEKIDLFGDAPESLGPQPWSHCPRITSQLESI